MRQFFFQCHIWIDFFQGNVTGVGHQLTVNILMAIWRKNCVVIFLLPYYRPLSLLSDKLGYPSFHVELSKRFLAICHAKSSKKCDIHVSPGSGSPLDFAWTEPKEFWLCFCRQSLHTPPPTKGNEGQHFISHMLMITEITLQG